MQNRRQILSGVVSALSLGAIAYLGYGFVTSLWHTAERESEPMLELPLGDLSQRPGGHIERAILGSRIFIVMAPMLKVYRIPYDRTYLLPDPTWDRPLYRCERFIFDRSTFLCADPAPSEWWREQLRWDASGSNLGGELPNLPELAFSAHDDVIEIDLRRR